jgi:hypothetical protein
MDELDIHRQVKKQKVDTIKCGFSPRTEETNKT